MRSPYHHLRFFFHHGPWTYLERAVCRATLSFERPDHQHIYPTSDSYLEVHLLGFGGLVSRNNSSSIHHFVQVHLKHSHKGVSLPCSACQKVLHLSERDGRAQLLGRGSPRLFTSVSSLGRLSSSLWRWFPAAWQVSSRYCADSIALYAWQSQLGVRSLSLRAWLCSCQLSIFLRFLWALHSLVEVVW